MTDKPLEGEVLPKSKWEKGGASPNPSGRPQGSRNKATLAVLAIMEDEGERISKKAVELALNGDMTAIKLVIERLIPVRKHRSLSIELPVLDSTENIIEAIKQVIMAASTGEISTREAQDFLIMLENLRKTLDVAELEHRLKIVEDKVGL